MPEGAVSAKDDRLTVTAVSVLACILQDVLHEGLGHGVTAWPSGARRVTMSTVAPQSDIDTPWIAAKWHPRESFLRGDLLAASSQATATQIRYFLFPRARNGGKFIYGHRLLLLFRSYQLW